MDFLEKFKKSKFNDIYGTGVTNYNSKCICASASVYKMVENGVWIIKDEGALDKQLDSSSFRCK